MRGCWIGASLADLRPPGPGPDSRRGMGTMAAFVIWIVVLAFLYAFMQSQAQSGALQGVARATALHTVVFAAQSALAEASHAMRHPPGGASPVLEALKGGRNSGLAHDPQATRDVWAGLVGAGRLEVDQVAYEVMARPPDDKSDEPYQVDLVVRTRYNAGTTRAATLTRQLRRRHLGRLCRVTATMGPSRGKVVYTSFHLQEDPYFEVIEP